MGNFTERVYAHAFPYDENHLFDDVHQPDTNKKATKTNCHLSQFNANGIEINRFNTKATASQQDNFDIKSNEENANFSKFSVLDTDTIDVLLSNGQYSTSMLKRWHRAFITAYPAGYITRNELIQLLKLYSDSQHTVTRIVDRIMGFCKNVVLSKTELESLCNVNNSNVVGGLFRFNALIISLCLISSRTSAHNKLRLAFSSYAKWATGRYVTRIEAKHLPHLLDCILLLMQPSFNQRNSDPNEQQRRQILEDAVLVAQDRRYIDIEEFLDFCLSYPLIVQVMNSSLISHPTAGINKR